MASDLVARAAGVCRKAFGSQKPDLAVILGSGLGGFSEALTKSTSLPYSKIPGFPTPHVPGHAGRCVLGRLGRRTVLVFEGRFHYYEGHPLSITTLPVRLAGRLGANTLLVTNAAGALRKELNPGSLALLRDHINLIGENPLRGPNLEKLGPRFVDLSTAYDAAYRTLARTIGRELGIDLPELVYAALPGPSYETPAEIRMLGTLGADLVGMSTVPEVIVARHQNMRVLGISCITNWAAGLAENGAVSHEEVLENSKRAKNLFLQLMEKWIVGYESQG